jgi:LTXXQ motif family protein
MVMAYRTKLTVLVVSTTLLSIPAVAQQQKHHPGQPAGSANQTQAAPQSMMGDMQGMMGNMRGMMGYMQEMMGHMQGMMGGMGPMGGRGMMSAMAGHVEGRIAFLKAELHITDAQQPLWNAVAESIRANAKTMSELRGKMMGAGETVSLPARLDAGEKLLQARLDAVRKLKRAVDPLYAALSDEQQKTADQLMPSPRMGMGMGPGMAGGRMTGMARP